jgi:hypothetical protein
MEGMMKVLRQSMETYTRDLLTRVCEEYGLPTGEVLEKYLSHDVVISQPPRKREVVAKPDARMCKGLTAKGGPCKFVAQEGCDLCGIHMRKAGQVPQSGVETTEKTMCRGLTAKGGPCKFVAQKGCEYCGTHLKKMGMANQAESSSSKPEEPPKQVVTLEQRLNNAMSLEERLKQIMAEEEPEEPEEEAEEEAEEKVFTYADENDIEPTPRPLDIIFPEVTAKIEELVDPVEKKLKKKEIRVKVQQVLEEEDSEVEEDAIEQMGDTPPSQQKLNEILEGL